MVTLAVSTSQWRADSKRFPTLTASTYSGGIVAKIGDSDYIDLLTEDLCYPLRNRSIKPLTVEVRAWSVLGGGWTLSTGITGSGNGPFTRAAGSPLTSYKGGYWPSGLNATRCTIEARMPSIGVRRSISIQDDTGFTGAHDPADPTVTHAMLFLENGIGQIWEKGVRAPVGGTFKWRVGDKGLIELNNGLIRYYLVRPHYSDVFDAVWGELILLRTTRSKIIGTTRPEFSIYNASATIDRVIITQNITATATLETIGALQGFQDWKNDFLVGSTADSIQMANNEPEFTFPNPKKRLRVVTPNLARRSTSERLAYEDFFNWHGLEKQFLFLDKAKNDIDGNSIEWWGRFSSALGDKSLNGCLASLSSQITESYRRDFIALEDDPAASTVVMHTPGGAISGTSSALRVDITQAAGALVMELDLYVDGKFIKTQIADPVSQRISTKTWVTIDTTAFTNGSHQIHVVARNSGGYETTSANVAFTITN